MVSGKEVVSRLPGEKDGQQANILKAIKNATGTDVIFL